MNLTLESRGGRLRWLVIAAFLPIMGLVIGGVLLASRELKAGSQLKAKLHELKQSGLPYDNASYGQWYRQKTHPEGMEAWVEVLEGISATSQLGAIDRLPFVGQGKELAELDPNIEWHEEANVKEFLNEMQGMIQKTHQLKQFPAPVQLPVEFHGVGTPLPYFQQARAVTRLMQLDFEYAFYHRDFERAMKDLHSIGVVAKAIDNNLCLVVDLIVSATLQAQYHEIQRSLVTDAWPQESLLVLRQSLHGVRHNASKWRDLFTSERAIFGDDVASGDLSHLIDARTVSFVPPLLNTGRLRIFEAYDELIETGNRELAALKSASKSVTANLMGRDRTLDMDGGKTWLALMLPSVEQLAKALENEENNRRLTITAIALRQFKLREGRWPAGLNQLERVGLNISDYSTVNQGGFGYEIANEVAYLWGGSDVLDLPVTKFRPRVDRVDSPTGEGALVTLR